MGVATDTWNNIQGVKFDYKTDFRLCLDKCEVTSRFSTALHERCCKVPGMWLAGSAFLLDFSFWLNQMCFFLLLEPLAPPENHNGGGCLELKCSSCLGSFSKLKGSMVDMLDLAEYSYTTRFVSQTWLDSPKTHNVIAVSVNGFFVSQHSGRRLLRQSHIASAHGSGWFSSGEELQKNSQLRELFSILPGKPLPRRFSSFQAGELLLLVSQDPVLKALIQPQTC